MNSKQCTAAVLLASITLLGCASPASAERGKSRPPIDTDGDGFVSQEEFSASRLSERADFSTIDADGDELLSADEIRSYINEIRRDRARSGRRNEE